MAATDAKAIPVKNAAYRVTFPILDADGDLVTGAATLDSEVSIDGGVFADATNEATEIATASGMYFLDLTAAEMNGDTIAIIVKTSTAGAKTTPIVLYTAARSINDLAFPTIAGRSIDVTATGEVGIDLDNTVGTLAKTTDLTGFNDLSAAQVNAEVDAALDTAIPAVNVANSVNDLLLDRLGPDTDDIQARLPAALVGGRMDSSVGAVAANAITAAGINADAITAAKLAADVSLEIADGVWDEARSGHVTLGTFGDSYAGLVTGSAIAGTLSTTQMTTDLTEVTDDHYNGRLIVWTSGVLAGQATDITDYTGATKLLTYTAITEAPAAGDDFVIY